MEARIQKYLALSEQGILEGPSFAVSGHFTEDGGVHVDQVHTCQFSTASIPFTDYDLLLLDASGAEIAWNSLKQESIHIVPVMRKDWKPGDSLGSYSQNTSNFNATVPRVEGGVTLVIERLGERLWTRHAPSEFPVITDLTGEIIDGTGRLRWSDNVAADCPEYCVRVIFENADGMYGRLSPTSSGNGENHVHQQLPRNVFEFNVTELPAGRVAVSVMLDTGFYSANTASVSLTIPERPITMQLLKAQPAIDPDASGKLEIHAFANAFDGVRGLIRDPAAFEWVIDGQPAGSGSCLRFDPPGIGQHVATVMVHWKGQRVSQSVGFEVTEKLLSEIRELHSELMKLFPLRPPPC